MPAEASTRAALAAAIVLAIGCKPVVRPIAVDAARPAAQASSPLGWRCPPGAKVCVDRAALSPGFHCGNERCVQLHPTMPDDGEWTCGEVAGVTLCTNGEAAAGVASAGAAPGWICGTRRGAATNHICIDTSPDFPDGRPTGWRCYYDGVALPNRICVRDAQGHVVGDACDARNPCVDGALCRAGICALPSRVPSCWIDADCPSGACRFGNCPGDPILNVVPPVPVPPTEIGEDSKSRLDFGPPQPQVGFDAQFAITVRVAAGPRPQQIAWKQIGGPALPQLHVTENGFRLSGRTVSWETALGSSELPWGVVPISPRTRGEAVLEASWSDTQGRFFRHEVRVAAASLSRGLTTIPTGGRVYLGGEGWRTVRAARGSHATIDEQAGLASFTPDLSGVWRLRDGKGRTLDLIAGRYDDVPLDCSRARCHAEMLAGAAVNPMTTVMARMLDGFPKQVPNADRAADYPECALACHATGEPGISDGGFYDLARSMNRTGEERVPWPAMPRVLRRLGGAGCLSCHGPGAVPDPRASWTTLRSDVCAICHDAPPSYGHVASWRSSANSRADRDPDAASKAPCTRCHTTWGFLLETKHTALPSATASGSAMVASQDHLTFMDSLRPPKQAGVIGIACAACHDLHAAVDASGKVPHALLRQIARPPLLPTLPDTSARRSNICLPCHTPDLSRSSAPFASAAAIWLGRGGLVPATGAAMEGPAPLADLDGGCLHCHTGKPGAVRGSNHTFVAPLESCPDCPKLDAKRPDGVRSRARQLYLDARLFKIVGDLRPLHASTAIIKRNSPASRALWNLLLLLEDNAAELHNPPYARALLEGAETVLRSPAALRELVGGQR
jgi:hypothetical protein